MIRSTVALSAAIALSASLAAADAAACSEIFIGNDAGIVVSARNFDYTPGPGFVRFNPAGVRRKAQYAPGGPALRWTSRYASIAFDKVLDAVSAGDGAYSAGVDGINTAGLKVGTYVLDDSKLPVSDGRPTIDTASLMQYFLDGFSSVEAVIRDLERGAYRIAATKIEDPDGDWPLGLHYFLHDASGATAIVEILDGQLRVTRDPQPPVLTNDTYASSLAYLQEIKDQGRFDDDPAKGKAADLPGSWDSLDRFVRAAYYLSKLPAPANAKQAVDFGVSALQAPAVPPMLFSDTSYATQWSIVTDIVHRRIHFRTLDNPGLATIDLGDLDHCGRPMRPVSIDLLRTDLQGDITPLFAHQACRPPQGKTGAH